MKRVLISFLLMLALPAILRSDGSDDAPAVSRRASVACWQYGIPTTTIAAGEPFQLRGSGFAVSLPVSVCFSGGQCLHSDVDASGAFHQNRIVRKPGNYLVTVRQARSRDLEAWILRATLQVQVTRETP